MSRRKRAIAMCHDHDALPPEPPETGKPATGEDLLLTSLDGTPYAASIARPAHIGAAQVIIFPDAGGLRQFYKDLAFRFAEQGILALTLDYYARSAGPGPRDETFDPRSHVGQLRQESFLDDVRSALAYLNKEAGTQARRAVFTVGFCAGGALSLLTATSDVAVDGAIGFYATVNMPIYRGEAGSITGQAQNTHTPVLALYGNADEYVPVSTIKEYEQGLEAAGVEQEVIIYPGVPHSFFDRRATEFASVSEDAWRRILAFIKAHSKE
jgi:carboxymethylenebutenolidase